MILVLLGTFQKDFSRPLKALDGAVQLGLIHEQIIVQAGHTLFTSTNMQIFKFFSSDELDKLYMAANLVITHAGVGSILKGLKLSKKMIAIARLNQYNEHVDDHQLDILDEFARQGYLIPWKENDNISSLIQKAATFTPAGLKQQQGELEEFLIEYIEALP